jgi:nicotinamide phosphoribosyltransferase
MVYKNPTNIIVDTDSYKASHPWQYQEGTTQDFRYVSPRMDSKTTIPVNEIVFFGLQIFLQEVLSKPFTMEDIIDAEEDFLAHGEPFPRKGFEHILKKYNGYIPVTIKAVPEGTVVPEGNVIVTIESVDDPECFWIAGWIEAMLLSDVWYMSTVATNSRVCKQKIYHYLKMSSDNPVQEILFKLHDFGRRGTSSRQSAEHGGAAHLVNFMGSDTVVGVRCANRNYNIPMAGFSIPAAEHGTITTWTKECEVKAYANMLKLYGQKGKVFACVSDSYDIFNACENIWGGVLRQAVIDSGAIVVIRPDSGNPAETVVKCLQILDRKFGSVTNKKGYKVLNNVRIIQGDGINVNSIDGICKAVIDAGFSMDNVNFGMGGGLLQDLNRDTFKFAMKSSATKVNGIWIDAFKTPIGDPSKNSIRGRISLYRIRDGHGCSSKFVTLRIDSEESKNAKEVLQIVYKNGELFNKSTFDRVRERAKLC